MATAKKQTDPSSAAPEVDPEEGVGGSYMADPTTGKRTLQHRTAPPSDVQPADNAQSAPVPPPAN